MKRNQFDWLYPMLLLAGFAGIGAMLGWGF